MPKKLLALFLLGLLIFGAPSARAVEQILYEGDSFAGVNQNTFVVDRDNTGGNVKLQFGDSLNEYLLWDNGSSYFSFSDDVDFGGNQLVNARIENIGSATCNSGAKGRLYFDTDNSLSYVCDGTSWKQIDAGGGDTTGTSSNLFVLDNDDTGGNVTLQFGQTLAQTLTWNNSTSMFELSGSLQVASLDVASIINVQDNIILNDFELLSARIENASTLTCDSSVKGKLYFDTDDSISYVCNGSDWKPIGLSPGGSNNDIQYNSSGALGGEAAFTYDQSTNQLTVPGAGITEDLALTGDISFSITADQDNYNPSGLSTAAVLRLTSDASRNITGLSGGADGRVITILNVGSNNIVLVAESASSTTSNRFDIGSNVTIGADQGVILIYDATSSRWRIPAVIGGSGSPGGSDTHVQYNASGAFTGEAAFTYDQSTNQLTVPGATITEDLALTGDISPAQITADQNNYSPTNCATSSVLRLNSSDAWDITGLDCSNADGRVLYIHNVGSNDIILADEDANSTAANRFALSWPVIVRPDGVVQLQYDSTVSRWRQVGGRTVGKRILASDQTDNTGNCTFQDVSGLSFEVIAAHTYYFRFLVTYTSSATTIGSTWSINGPSTTNLHYHVSYPSTTTSTLVIAESITAYNSPSACTTASASASSNLAIIEGYITPSADGTLTARMAAENGGTIVALSGGLSHVTWEMMD